jgi:FixJ family two-component response regulator
MQVHNVSGRSNDRVLMRTTAATVFIVAEDPSVHEFMASLVEPQGWAIESFASADEFLARLPTVSPSCLVLDLSDPQLDGLALHEILADRGVTPPIFVAAHQHGRMADRAMKAGAVDLLTKPLCGPSMNSAVRSALDQSRRALAEGVAMSALQQRYESLSRREWEVLRLVVSGRLNKQIGAELGISVVTVKAHRGKMMRKMVATSIAELVNMGTRLGIGAADR